MLSQVKQFMCKQIIIEGIIHMLLACVSKLFSMHFKQAAMKSKRGIKALCVAMVLVD